MGCMAPRRRHHPARHRALAAYRDYKNMENGHPQVNNKSVRGGSRLSEFLLTLPTSFWLILFFVIPAVLVFSIAFKVSDPLGGIGDEWTLATVKNVLRSDYIIVIWRTIWVSVVVTALCLLLSIPVAYWIAQQPKKYRYWYLLLIIIRHDSV